VVIGCQAGYLYALDAATGVLKWQFPKATDPALVASDPTWRYGIQTSASFWNQRDWVIVGAQDPSLGSFGSARLFGLDLNTGALVWKSDGITEINGTTSCNTDELHQRFAWSSPLIFNGKVYIGVHDFGDTPIQVGRVIAVDIATGHIDTSFNFQAVGPSSPLNTPPDSMRGGGVWNAIATDLDGIFFTTGNTRTDQCPTQVQSEPSPNHGLSMIRVDSQTGGLVWKFQPVPFKLDDDPDWAAGATVMPATCGKLIASVQKDGWSYAVDARTGICRWQFPPAPQSPPTPSCTWTGYSQFDPNGPRKHGDDDYRRPGAAWNDVFIIRTGGESLDHDGVTAGYGKLHALNACATVEVERVRWLADIPSSSQGRYSLGAPTVTGGIVFIGTDLGHLVVLGDPSVVPPDELRCSNIDYTTADCAAAGYALVPRPRVLADKAVPDHGNLVAMRNEPALSDGRVFVGTSNGHVYMLEPEVP
jgi:outer membrane protein assembly factor BamB